MDLLLESHPQLIPEQIEAMQSRLEESDFPFKTDLLRTEDLFLPYRDQVMKDRRELFRV